MLEQLADRSQDEKTGKLEEFRTQIKEELKSAEDFKRDHPDREDMNALVELALAIEEEVNAVVDLVKIGEDCQEDWNDLEEARCSLTRTLARITHQNWITLGPSHSKRINQLFFYQKKKPESKETESLLSELKEVTKLMLVEDLTPELQMGLEGLLRILDKGPGKGFLRKLSGQLAQFEESMDVSLFDAPLEGDMKCAVCGGELESGAERCPSCGATVYNLKQPRVAQKEQDAGRSQLLDSLNHSWKLYQHEEINQDNFLRILKNLSGPISSAVEKLESPSAALMDFATRLEMFTKLPDRKSLESHWPSLLASGRTLVAERLNKLERD